MGKKDPNAPKRPLSAYFTWLGENRERIKQENPTLPHKEITSKLGELWNALDEDTKKSYKDKAQAEMAEWKVKFDAYKKTDNYRNFQATKSTGGKKGKKSKPPKDPNAPKRPSTGFFLFVSDKREEVKASLPEDQQKKVTVVTKKCGELWKACSDEAKAKYQDRSKQLKAKYEEELQEYKQTQDYADFQERLRQWKSSQKEQKTKKHASMRRRQQQSESEDEVDSESS